MKTKKGFTLVEILVAIIFIGIAITAIVAGNTALTQANGFANEISIAEFLNEQIKERVFTINYSNLLSLDNTSYSPPIDAKETALTDFSGFSQVVIVENVSNTNFTQVVADNSSNFIRVTVKILMGTREINSSSWIRAKY